MTEKPTFIFREEMTTDESYVQWMADIKQRFRQSQVKASVHVNTSMLEFYWSVGRDLVALRAEERWGASVVKQFALDMRQAFPNETGFSDTNVKYMKRWYLFYYERVKKGQRPVDLIGHQAGGQLEAPENGQQLADELSMTIRQRVIDEKGQRFVDQLEMPEFFGRVPWGQHIDIVSRCETMEEAMFYIQQVVDGGWSRPKLNTNIDKQLYQSQGTALTNFEHTLPAPQSQLAKELLKDPYHFEFLTMKEEYEEKDLEDALVSNVTRFLMELGQGFSYVGRQMELQMPGGQTFFPDLLFYHIPQHRYVVIELKVVKFIPEFAGKLNFYVTAIDELMRGEGDNPTVGLLICKSTDKTVVEWSLRDINKPLGVSTYQLEKVVERTVKELEQKKKEGLRK